MSGWFAMKHGISAHHLFKGRPERMAVWVWLVDNAAYSDTPHDINGVTIIVKRGQVAASERHIATQTGVGYQSVRTFIARLKTEGMINAQATHGKNVITLCNYEKYQTPKKGGNAAPNAALTHDQRTKEQDNNIPVGETVKTAPSKVVDLSSPKAAVWAIGKAFLAKHGVRNEGAVIGRFLKTSTDIEVLAAIQSAETSGTHDPVPYITEILKPKKKQFRDMTNREQAQALL